MQLSELNAKIIETITDDDELDQEVAKSIEYDDNLMVNIEKLSLHIAARKESEVAAVPSDDHRTQSNQSSLTECTEVRNPELPKLQITSFGGNPLEWAEFWDDFTGTVHNRNDLTVISKFKYLKKCLRGEALRAVDGFRLTNANYEQVIEVLKDRFGDPGIAAQAHFETLFSLPAASNNIEELREVFDKCETHIRSLAALGFGEDTFGPVFAPMLLSKLPWLVNVEIQRRSGSKPWSLSALRAIIKEEIKAREQAGRTSAGQSSGEHSKGRQAFQPKETSNKGKPKYATTSALVSPTSTQNQWKSKHVSCAYCQGNHYSDRCTKYPDSSSRLARLSSSACACCLTIGHSKNECQSRRPCVFCNKSNHHRSLCKVKFPPAKAHATVATHHLNPEALEFTPKQDSVGTVNTTEKRTILATALVGVKGIRHEGTARLVFDTAATRSFITKEKADEVGAKMVREEAVSLGTFNDKKRKTVRRKIVEVDITLLGGGSQTIEVCVVDAISAPVLLYPLELEDMTLLTGLRLAEPILTVPTVAEAHILLGLDYYHSFMGDHIIRCSNGIALQLSKVGYVAYGITDGTPTDPPQAHDACFTFATAEDTDFERFWRIEDIGVKDCPNAEDDEVALKKFNDTVKVVDDRYEVQWPWRMEDPDLKTHENLAIGRLRFVMRRLVTDEHARSQYDKIIKDQLDKGVIEVAPVVPDGLVHYIPHHAVVTPSKATTKVRMVFDASAKTSKDDPSINECLYRGPVILQDLVGLLLRFRLHRIAVVSDIEKAFLQIGLQITERDQARFFFPKDISKPITKENLVTYRFTRVPFGYVSSPFLLGACILHLLQSVGSEVARKIEQNLYVDNVFGGEETVQNY
jgi:hypothetical protein